MLVPVRPFVSMGNTAASRFPGMTTTHGGPYVEAGMDPLQAGEDT